MKRFFAILLGAALFFSVDAHALRGGGGGSVSATSIATAESGEDSLTAFATGGQTSATALSATVTNHRVSTVATAGDSVKLPAATVGLRHYVRNDGVAAMQVFGQSTETINGVASATGISQAPGMGVWYICTTAGAWTTSPVSTITATTQFLAPTGANLTPSYSFSGATGVGMYNAGSGFAGIAGSNGAQIFAGTTGALLSAPTILQVPSGAYIGWSSGVLTSSTDTAMVRAATNSIQFSGGTSAAGAATARTELNKSVTGIANAVATDVLTVTIPNAAHSASLRTRITCSLGAGGAIGANEATATNTYMTVITRTAGVATVVAISSASDAAASAVAGAATVTATLANTAMTGAVGATQTFTQQATVSRSGGSSTNHTCLVHAQLMNANSTGVTIQ
jgi:hypothetical protein